VALSGQELENRLGAVSDAITWYSQLICPEPERPTSDIYSKLLRKVEMFLLRYKKKQKLL